MSGYRTHALIGAVGGLASYRLLDRYAPEITSGQLSAFGQTYALPQLAVAAVFVIVPAFLAIWPDIDEAGSRIGLLFQSWLGPMAGIFAGASVALSGHDWISALIVGGIAFGAGALLAAPILSVIHQLAGGHRRLTHSLLLGLPLLIGGTLLWARDLHLAGLPFLLIGFGQLLHLVGDIVTPGGVPIFYPLSKWEFHALPPASAEFGEPLIAALVLCLGAGLLLV